MEGNSLKCCAHGLLQTAYYTQTTKAGNHHLTCIFTAIPHPPQSVSDTTRQLGPIGVKEWPGSSPCRSQDAQYGVTSWFQEPYQVCAYAYKSCLCRHQYLVGLIAGPLAGVCSFHLQCLLPTLFQFRPPPYQPHMDEQISRKPTEYVSPFGNNGSSNRLNCYRQKRLIGEPATRYCPVARYDQHRCSIRNTATHTTVESLLHHQHQLSSLKLPGCAKAL